MKNKGVIFFDIDGVILLKNKNYDVLIKEKLDICQSDFKKYFFDKEDWHIYAMVGKKPVKPILIKAIEDMKRKDLTTNSLINFWLENRYFIDSRVLKVIDDLKGKGFKIYLATDQSHIKMNYLCNKYNFEKIFEGIFYSAGIGYRKKSKHFWNYIKHNTDIDFDESLFIDDVNDNIKVANSCGIKGYLYKDFTTADIELFKNL
ncbi:MAG: hypothetical protein OIF36_05395 [Alphaproteobacteria bacterium]|nr:hypothetical protein [Alphaproteobacteria bacterium]